VVTRSILENFAKQKLVKQSVLLLCETSLPEAKTVRNIVKYHFIFWLISMKLGKFVTIVQVFYGQKKFAFRANKK